MSTGLGDLYVGGDMGKWALGKVAPEQVKTVVTGEEELRAAAQARGLTVHAPATGAGGEHWDQFEVGKAAVSVHYHGILPGALLQRYHGAAYNLHPGYLPWGRGFYPVFWALCPM